MITKHHASHYPDHIFLVVRIIVAKCLKYPLLNEPLLKQALLVQQYLKRHILLVFVVEALVDLAE